MEKCYQMIFTLWDRAMGFMFMEYMPFYFIYLFYTAEVAKIYLFVYGI